MSSSYKSTVTLGNLGNPKSASAPAPPPAPAPAHTRTRARPRAQAPAPAPAPAPASMVSTPESIAARTQLQSLQLPHELLVSYKRKFDALDLNKDGMISLREFAAVGMVFGYRLSMEELREIFGRRDLDMSGTITFDEFALALKQRTDRNRRMAPLKQKFSQFDTRSRGYVTADEAYPILKRDLGFDLNKTETMVDQFDKNRDYRLSLFEFEPFFDKYEELKVEMHKAFQRFDKNGDGYIDVEELKEGLVPRGFTENQVVRILQDSDRDGDGRLSYTEFITFWDLPIF